MFYYTQMTSVGTIAMRVAISTAIAVPAWTAESYYVFDGNNMSTVFDSPQNAHVDQWAAFYFKRGASVSVLSQRWGMDLGSSPSEVIAKVEKNQKFEKRYEKWCGCSWGSDTFFNAAVPVAMVKEASSARLTAKQSEILDKLHTGWDRLQLVIKAFNAAADWAGEAKLPRLNYKGPFAEYMAVLHRATDTFNRISHEVTRYSDAALGVLEADLDKFTADV